MKRGTAIAIGAVVTFGTAAVPALNAVLGGAVAGSVVDDDRTVAGAGVGALGSAVAGLVLGTLFYAFLSGLGGPVATTAWVRGLVVVAGGAAVVAAATGGTFGAIGATLVSGSDGD